MSGKIKQNKNKIGILIVCLFLLYFFYSAYSYSTSYKVETTVHTNDFVRLKDGKFICDKKPFYPLVLNYIVSLQGNDQEMWPSPSDSYFPDNIFPSIRKDSALYQLEAHFRLIKKMGFNTLRIVGIGEPSEKINKEKLEISYYYKDNKRKYLFLDTRVNYDKYLNAISELVSIAKKVDLKIIFLAQMHAIFYPNSTYLKEITYHFRNEPTIMAYDLFNEPLYFDDDNREKKDAYQFVKNWNEIQKKNAPLQLSTIGLEGIREVFRWDPSILDLDFISYHPYEYEPNQVLNEIYWYMNNTHKPWIIGETAIPADNDSVPYSSQLDFARKTLRQTYNCGGIGYSWWQYKDVNWLKFHADYMGIVSQKGTTHVDSFKVRGTVKPTAKAFQEFEFGQQRGNPLFLSNYYNYSEHNGFRIKAKVVDENGKPIEGAVILGWNENWSSSYHSISKPDGKMNLKSDFKVFYWMISAPGREMVRDDTDLTKITKDGYNQTVDLGTIVLKKVNFISNS